jgi:hypothetical protein
MVNVLSSSDPAVGAALTALRDGSGPDRCPSTSINGGNYFGADAPFGGFKQSPQTTKSHQQRQHPKT